MLLAPGSLIADRFRVEKRAGVGGMGVVYRAHDEIADRPVALKLLLSTDLTDVNRFEREANLLASLAHPGIVAPIDRGALPTGEPFLVMEWLEGIDLAARLARGTLSVPESLTLLRVAATALAAAHAAGVIHRDIKPGNLFLRGGRVEAVTLLDFGIARRMGTGAHLTKTGATLGTPHYMAPEQALGDGNIGPASDIFSLGCVLFECLTGKPPFAGAHTLAVIAKIIFEEAPLLRSKIPDLDPALEELCARMLEKKPAARIADATALLAALDALESPSPHAFAQPASKTARLTTHENEIVCVIVVQRPEDILPADEERLASITTTLTSLGVHPETLADGTVVATLSALGQATDQVARAARSALLLLERFPEAHVALATGRARAGARAGVPVGEAIDKAFSLSTGLDRTDEGVLLDDVTAGLLDDRFLVDVTPTGRTLLRGERAFADESRPLLGRPTPCVGRERELGLLQSAWEECTNDCSAHAILVVAPPGTGKSRLRHEFMRRLARDGVHYNQLVARGDPLAASALGLIPRALRAAFGVEDHEGQGAQRAKVEAWIKSRVAPADARRLIDFTGELAGVPFPDDANPRLRIARQDPRILAEQMTMAFVDLCRVLSTDAPLLILLEDLHWGDPFSVELVGAVLRELEGQPLLVLALARPEVHEVFPRLWGDRAEQLALHALRARAAEQLAHAVLGERASAEEVRRVVELSAGNALFLEELIRAVAEGRGDDLPETVLAVLQARIGRLSPELRRALRAASIFGLTCKEDGVRALLGPDAQVRACLDALVAQETLERRRPADLDGEVEYAFRHALVREAAYGLLVEEDRLLGHRLAAEWLVTMRADPATIADHFHRDGAPPQAVPYCIRAAEQALARNDLDRAVRYATLGEAWGAEGIDLGVLLTIRAHALRNGSAIGQSIIDVTRATTLLPEGHPLWCWAMGNRFALAALLGRKEESTESARRFLQVDPDEGAHLNYAMSLWFIVGASLQAGLRDQAGPALERLLVATRDVLSANPAMPAWICLARYEYLRHVRPDPWQHVALLQDALRMFETYEVGQHYELIVLRNYLAVAHAELGDPERAAELLRQNLAETRTRGAHYLLTHTQIHFAEALHQRVVDPPVDEITATTLEVLARGGIFAGFQSMARGFLSWAQLERGELEEAEARCESAIQSSANFPFRKLRMQATLLRILVRAGNLSKARAVAEEAVDRIADIGGAGYAEIAIRTAAALAFHAAGDAACAHENLRIALAEIDRQAGTIPDPALRDRFRSGVADNARALDLAAAWGVTP
jgi:serine/threonine protein kinase/tetratricopeptide (TPR) repeat protein